MSKANVVSLVALFGRGQEDPTLVDTYYADLMWDVAQAPAFVMATLDAVVAGTAVYPWPTSAADLIALFYDDEWLRPATVREAEIGFGDGWRSARGRPLVYVTEDRSAREVRLFPTPDVSSDPIAFVFGEPMGRDFPRGALTWLVTERRDDLPTEFDLPFALGVVGREFARASNHRDLPFAQACGEVSKLMSGWLR